MQFLKVLGLLSFLVTSNLAYAIAIYEKSHHQEDSSNFPQINQELQVAWESILTAPSNLLFSHPNSAFGEPDFVFRGSNSARKANAYIRYAATIKPGLDKQKIIFPFHTFL
ncbi:hypothetical protein ACKGJN_15460 [Gillisia sp. Q332]|uniref:hypothetical protein n=1 Tax=Gillisia xinjiangensis TaxID=3384765 RepID=UPI00391AD379